MIKINDKKLMDKVYSQYFNNNSNKILAAKFEESKSSVEEEQKKLTAESNIDLEGFTNTFKSLLEEAFEDDLENFTMEMPTEKDIESINLPAISFGVVSRTNSTIHPGLKLRPTDIIQDEEQPEYNLILFRKWFDCEVEFMVYNKTNLDARKTAGRLESFIELYKGIFKSQGISEIIFIGEVDPRNSIKFINGLPSVCLRYKLILECVHYERFRTVKSLESKINLNKL